MIAARVETGDFDPGVELARLGGAGAVASFIGHVRADDGVAALFLEHHPVMTAAALHALGEAAMRRWPLAGVVIVHRVGLIAAGQRIVLAAAAAPHRADALDACAFLIDRLKTDVMLWKREHLADGTTRWVDPRPTDDARAEAWG